MHVDRLKTFRTFRDDGVVITGEGTSLETRSAVYRTVVEFIIQLEEPITNTDDELDPTQAAELLIVRLHPLCCSWLCLAPVELSQHGGRGAGLYLCAGVLT